MSLPPTTASVPELFRNEMLFRNVDRAVPPLLEMIEPPNALPPYAMAALIVQKSVPENTIAPALVTVTEPARVSLVPLLKPRKTSVPLLARVGPPLLTEPATMPEPVNLPFAAVTIPLLKACVPP